MLLVAICWKCKLYLQVLGHVLYAAVMLPKFYKITSLEKKIFYTGYQQARRLSFTRFLSLWKYWLGISVGLQAHRLLVGVGVCRYKLYEFPLRGTIVDGEVIVINPSTTIHNSILGASNYKIALTHIKTHPHPY